MAKKTSGGTWSDLESWRALCDGTGCPICAAGRPRDVIAEFPSSWVTAPAVAPLPGYVAVVSKSHVVEPYELAAEDRAAFWEDVMTAARALARLLRPIKMNYEIHGNTIPHLHAHLYPRQTDDPFVGGPIDPTRASVSRTPSERHRIRQAIRQARPRRRRRTA
jgi:diadenosine tetraphosphate (Ap4A) HIT family hydrolase